MHKLQKYRPALLILSILGFAVINLPFLYIAVFRTEIYDAGLANGLAQVFMAEALLLMVFFSFLIHAIGWKKPGWFSFILMSIVGSMAFSIPLYLYIYSKPDQASE